MTTAVLQRHVVSRFKEASKDGDPLKSIALLIAEFFPRLVMDRHNATMVLNSVFSLRVKGYDEFLIWENRNRNGGPLHDFTEGKFCNSEELIAELAKFSGVNLG